MAFFIKDAYGYLKGPYSSVTKAVASAKSTISNGQTIKIMEGEIVASVKEKREVIVEYMHKVIPQKS